MKIHNIVLAGILGVALIGNAIADLHDGLVAYYPFNGNANDQSGNKNDGVVNGATLTTDRFGNIDSAYEFDGSNDHIVIASSSSFDLESEISISIWFKPYSLEPTDTNLISKWKTESDSSGSWFFHFSSGHLKFVTTGDGADGSYFAIKLNSININDFYHVVGTYNSTNNMIKIYINGELKAEAEGQNNLFVSNSKILIGALSYSRANYFFNGIIDEVRIYNRALSDSEIQQLDQETAKACTEGYAYTVTPNLDIHLPSLNYQTLSGSLNFWVDLEFYGNEGNNLLWKLKDFGENSGGNVGCAPDDSVIVSPNLDIQLLSIDYQLISGTLNLWANFEYYGQGDNGELLWRLLEYGENQ